MEPLLGQIILFAGNFAPKGWAFCNGQLLSIAQNEALFAILGTTYGGDGRTTFALPDLRGRVPVGPGQGPGLSNYGLGVSGGLEQVVLTPQQVPAHTHAVACNGDRERTVASDPTNKFPGRTGEHQTTYAETSNAQMNANVIGLAGGGQAHENRMPYLGLNYIIALQGIFPARA